MTVPDPTVGWLMTVQSAAAAHPTAGELAPWRTLADGRDRIERRPTPPMWHTLVALALASTVALGAILLLGVYVARQAAEAEALRDARAATDILAHTVVEPALRDGLLSGDPAAIALLDRVMTQHVLTEDRIRVKLWTADGRIVYSDEPALIGERFPLDPDKAAALRGRDPVAELSHLDGPENRFERPEGPLFEVYRHVETPDGTHLLFETYSRYSQLTERRGEILRSFAPIMGGSVVLLQLCQLPLVWTLVRRLRAAQDSSERLLRRAVDASTAERRRIAGNVHDSVVQGLAGASFVIAGAVDAVERNGQPKVAADLREASSGIRESIRGLRSMLVEIYPPSVSVAGLPTALQDLVAPLRAQGITATAQTPASVDLPRSLESLIFRVAQESLRNVAQHSGARNARLSLEVGPDVVRLEVADDGSGVDVEKALGRRDGHVGMQVLRDLAEEAGALLQIRSAWGAGTTVRLEVPLP